MATHIYDFVPGDITFAIINNDCVKEVTILQYTFETYMVDPDTIIEEGVYIVQFNKEEETAYVSAENLFTDPMEALAEIGVRLT